MQAKKFTKYSSLELTQVPQNAPTRMYSIAPLYIGSSGIESLSSYISRLALAHCVYPGILMKTIINSLEDKQYSSNNIYQIYSHTAIVNGTGNMASDLSDVLTKLTHQKDLHLLNLTSLSKLLPSRELLSKHRAWCPNCYEDWRTCDLKIYDPLLWVIKTVKVCPKHNVTLKQTCSYCGKKSGHLAWKTRPGFCSACDKWLGSKQEYNISSPHNRLNRELNWNVWIANNIGELLAKNSLLKSSFSEKHISESLSSYIQQKAEGNIAAFARQLKIPKNTVWLWSKGKNKPSLEMLLRICHRLDVSIWEFLTGDKSVVAKDNERDSTTSIPLLKIKAKAQAIDKNRMRQYLEKALKRSQANPISMVQVAQASPFNRRTLYFYFPELCQEISANYARHRKANHERAIIESCQEVRKAVNQLHSEGKYPSQNKVEKLISRPGLLRYEEVKKAFIQAKQDLN